MVHDSFRFQIWNEFRLPSSVAEYNRHLRPADSTRLIRFGYAENWFGMMVVSIAFRGMVLPAMRQPFLEPGHHPVPEATHGPAPLSCELAMEISTRSGRSRPCDFFEPTCSQPPSGPAPIQNRDYEPGEENSRTKIRMQGKAASDLPGGRCIASNQPLRGLGKTWRPSHKSCKRPKRVDGCASCFWCIPYGADFFTGHMRRVLQRRYGDIGHGFVCPAALYSGYRANDINLCRSEGWSSDWVGRTDGHGDGMYGFAAPR